MTGSVISHYRILEKLGEGGMGVVYKAHDTRLDRDVALKFLPAHLAASREDNARFMQEARAAAALNHPNICTIFGISEHDGQMFIVMEFINGQLLKEKHGIASVEQAIDIGIQIADGLAAAHERGIVHRDIKPENIMVRTDGIVQIMDFGLAKLQGISTMTKAGSTIGTTTYMSPEQVQGIEADNRSDIFSLGVVLYELLTGQLPFKGAHEAAVMYEIVHVAPLSPAMVRPDIDQASEDIVMKCLEKDITKRYQNVREVSADLRAILRRKESPEAQRRARSPANTRAESSALTSIRPAIKIAMAVGIIALLLVAGIYVIPNRGESIESMAVLPFENASKDPSMEFLSDGITESLINALSQLPKLKVMSRNSVFHFKGDNPQSVGQKLHVQALLLGRVLQRGENLMISAELIDVSDNTHLWGDQYNRKSADILAVQEEITREISQKLRQRFANEDNKNLTRPSTDNTQAYELYLKGRYHWNKRSIDGLRKAIGYFQQAVDADPHYALAYSGLSDAYQVLGWFEYGVVSPLDVYPKAKAAAERAVELDPTRAEGYTSLAFSDMHNHNADTVSAEKNFRRALELDPTYPTAHHWYSELLMSNGRVEESIGEMKRALSLDPLSLVITRDVGWMLYFARRYDEAEDYIRKSLDLDSNFSRGHMLLGECYLQQGAYDQAIAELETASKLSEGSVSRAMLGLAYARAGKNREANRILQDLLAASTKQYVPPGGIAMVFLGLGDKDKAFEWLDKAVDAGYGIFAFVNVDPVFDSLRNDPRFTTLMKRREYIH